MYTYKRIRFSGCNVEGSLKSDSFSIDTSRASLAPANLPRTRPRLFSRRQPMEKPGSLIAHIEAFVDSARVPNQHVLLFCVFFLLLRFLKCLFLAFLWLFQLFLLFPRFVLLWSLFRTDCAAGSEETGSKRVL